MGGSRRGSAYGRVGMRIAREHIESGAVGRYTELCLLVTLTGGCGVHLAKQEAEKRLAASKG